MSTSEMEFNKTKQEVYQVLCKGCRHKTKHIVLSSVDTLFRGYSESLGDDYRQDDHFQVIQCLGCESISFRHASSNSEDTDYVGEYFDELIYCVTETIYPKRTTETINEKSFLHLPLKLKKVYLEVIASYNNDIYVLCGSGLRALVEGICIDNNILGGKTTKKAYNNRLEGKINGLYEGGILTEKYTDTLHEFRFLGNDAMHQLYLPDAKELSLAIHIIEHIIETIYEVPVTSNSLKQLRSR